MRLTLRLLSMTLLAVMLLGGCQPDAEEDEAMSERDARTEAGADETAPGDGEPLVRLAAHNRDFAWSLMSALREQESGNLFISPYSISAALAMVLAGAEGNTRAQMAEVLRLQLDDADLHAAFGQLGQALAQRAEFEPEEEGEAFRLSIVNRTWGQRDFEFRQDYLDLLSDDYGAGLELVDFKTQFESVRADINRWVEQRTEDRIVDLLPPRSLDADTRFVLVNAIYFLASWKHAFEAEDTADEPFRRLGGDRVEVPMMRQVARLGYFRDDHTVAVSMPYVGDQVSLVAFMPADGSADFGQWERELERSRFDEMVAGLSGQEVRVHFPRFESEADLRLSELLERMGMVDAFDECAANFRGMTGAEPCIPDRSVYIDEIFHKSFVSVDEAGTEAAAATAVVMMRVTAAGPEPETVRFDRPFYYAIYDHPTDTILFMGRLVDPEA